MKLVLFLGIISSKWYSYKLKLGNCWIRNLVVSQLTTNISAFALHLNTFVVICLYEVSKWRYFTAFPFLCYVSPVMQPLSVIRYILCLPVNCILDWSEQWIQEKYDMTGWVVLRLHILCFATFLKAFWICYFFVLSGVTNVPIVMHIVMHR